MPPPANPAYASPSYTATPITGDRLKALDPNSVRMLWKKGVEVYEQAEDFWRPYMSADPLSLIQTESSLSAGAGQKIIFTNRSGLYFEPHLGDARFHDSKHYEELKIGSNELTVDWFRHGVEYTERAEEVMGMRGELLAGLPDELGKYSGRLSSEKVFMLLREQVPGENKITINGTLNYNAIVTYAQNMKRWGAASAAVGRMKNGQALRRYMVVTPEDALTSLKLDSDYKDALKNTSREEGGYFFSGGVTDVDGHLIRPYNGVEHDGYGAIGSPMNPLARLANARTSIAAGAANYIIGGGSDYDADLLDWVKTMKYFPGYDYPVQAGVTLVGSAADFFVAIVNPPNAETDPGKYGLYKIGTVTNGTTPIKSNDGNQLIIKTALGASVVAATGSSYGANVVTAAGALGTNSPAWNAAIHTNNHPVDALVVLVWPDAIPMFCSFMLGAACARRGYGKYRNNRTFQNKEGNFVRDVYFNTVMGQSLRKNRKGRVPGVTTLWHKGILAGTPLPTP